MFIFRWSRRLTGTLPTETFTFSVLHYDGGVLEEGDEEVAGLQVGIQRQLRVAHHYTNKTAALSYSSYCFTGANKKPAQHLGRVFPAQVNSLKVRLFF